MVAADQHRLSLRQPVGRVACALLVSVQLRRGERKIGPDERPPIRRPAVTVLNGYAAGGIDANDAEQVLVDGGRIVSVSSPRSV